MRDSLGITRDHNQNTDEGQLRFRSRVHSDVTHLELPPWSRLAGKWHRYFLVLFYPVQHLIQLVCCIRVSC